MKNYLLYFFLFPLLAFSFRNSDEKQVNTFTKSYQREPAIAINNSDGSFIVVWTSNMQDGDGEGIFAQYFDSDCSPVRKEFQVNTTFKYDQNKPAVTMNSKGKCAIVWASTKPDNSLQDIFCQLFDYNGNKIGNEFLVNTTIEKSQNSPDISMDDNGNFVVVWHSWDNDGSDRGIFAQRFNSDGTKNGKEFLVNTYTKYSQCEPSISMKPNGSFIIAWQSWGQENPNDDNFIDYGIYAQMYNNNGIKIGKEIHVNTITKDDQFFPDVSINKNGEFIIAWTSWNSQSENYSEIKAQSFDKNGSKKGNEVTINSTLLHYQWLPSVIMNNDCSFSAAWGSWKQDKSREGIYLQSINPDGTKRGNELQINVYTDSYQWEPQIISTNKREIVTVYSSWNQDGDDYGVFINKTLIQ